MNFQKDQPYNDLPLLLPDPAKWETVEIYKKLADARAAIAELKGRLPSIPNPLMLINTLVLQEAKDSSTIENIFTTSDNLYRALSVPGDKSDSATKEVLRYREALWSAFTQMQWTGELNEESAITIFRSITEKNEGVRTSRVYVGSRHQIIYTPPEPGDPLQQKLTNWVEILSSQDQVDPLIKMAMLHYQFEAIHPFIDGNGRTGRIINVLYLCRQNLINLPVFYHSKYILENKSEYYRLLREVTEKGNWQEWILFMLFVAEETARFTLLKVNMIMESYAETTEKVRSEAPDIYSHELISTIYSQPYCKIAFLEQQKIASRNTARKYLKRLEELGILESEMVSREVVYKNVSLLDILSH